MRAWCVRTRLDATTSEEVAWTAGLPGPEPQASVRDQEDLLECYCGGRAGVGARGLSSRRCTRTSLAAHFLLMIWGAEVCSAMESPPTTGGALADTILDRVAADRVRRFRITYSLHEDQDFAGFFTSWVEAMKAGGSAVADAWMEVAADVDDAILLRAVDEAHVAAAAGGVTCHSPLQALQAVLQGSSEAYQGHRA